MGHPNPTTLHPAPRTHSHSSVLLPPSLLSRLSSFRYHYQKVSINKLPISTSSTTTQHSLPCLRSTLPQHANRTTQMT
ncbi:hypothetical protein E2C01_096713 [Portunus trituberculatus]|uniref:Uncharacterized protein n=1 Tax=Portunus trituberculatus TaxID=210409 RepID=A0A5B7K969_PORTR|nr:hypothetical protein [Portunus trituberculatus]